MPRLRIRHESNYAYSMPGQVPLLGAGACLMRPLDTHATRLIKARLSKPRRAN